MRYLISGYKYAPKLSKIRPEIPRTGKIGLFLLGLSFLFWAILMAGSTVDGGPMVFINSMLGTILGISSIGLTIAGIILTCTVVAKVPLSGKYFLLWSSIVFAAINIAGYYLLTHSIYGGIAIPDSPDSFVIYLAIASIIYFAFVLIFNFVILPFLESTGRKLLLVASVFAALYLMAITISTIYAPNNFSASIPTLPGDNMLSSVFFLSPFFGVPGFLLTDGVLNLPSWAMAFPLVSNLIYAFLYFSSSKALKLGKTETGMFE